MWGLNPNTPLHRRERCFARVKTELVAQKSLATCVGLDLRKYDWPR